MKADTVDLAAVFGQPIHYVVPLYQRPYVWTRDLQWDPLWEDVRQVADRQLDATPANDSIPHFLGAVVLDQLPNQVGKIGGRTVIDGQQRLTTLQLMIAAVRSIATERGLVNQRKEMEGLLFNADYLVREVGDEFKVLPTARDRTAFREALGDGVVAATGGHRMHEAYRFFRGAILAWASESGDEATFARHIDALANVIWKRLVIVTIDLDRGDNAQVIFETLNARGTPLLAADLVKNHLFQLATIQDANLDDLYEKFWKPLDTDWWREEKQQGRLKRPRLDSFINHYLAMSTGHEVVSHQLFQEFKRYLANGQRSAAEELVTLERYARVYARFENEPSTTELGLFLYRLNTMEVTTAYPALLWLLGPDGLADPVEQRAALDAIESWLVRRLLIRATTKNYNTVFLALLKAVRDAASVRGGPPVASDVISHLLGLAGESQVWPTSSAVRATLRTIPAYSVFPRSRLRMVLEALERAQYVGMEEKVTIETDLTIEHILPQQWGAHWPLPEGVDPIQGRLDRDEVKHRLGNLTLLTQKLNSASSNAAWSEKRPKLVKYSVLHLADDLREAAVWDEAAIARRARHLSDVAVGVWARPDDGDGEEPVDAAEATSVGSSRPAGPPDPDDPSAFASPLAIADEVGVGPELRQIIRACREMGLHPRPDRYSVMISPPSDKRLYLFTLWPQWDEGGSFKLWKSPKAFAKRIPGVSLQAAQAVLGASEDPGVLLPHDTESLLESIRGLVPAEWATTSFDDRRAELIAMGIPNMDRAPGDVLRLIDHRADGSPDIALEFAGRAMELEGVVLRPQQSKGDPWYFQVRHPKFSQVVSYCYPRRGEIRLELRLPSDHETHGLAEVREGNQYGIVVTARDAEQVDTTLRLLRDALTRAD